MTDRTEALAPIAARMERRIERTLEATSKTWEEALFANYQGCHRFEVVAHAEPRLGRRIPKSWPHWKIAEAVIALGR